MFVFQSKLELIVGTPAAFMDLDLFSTSDKFLQKLDNNEALFGSYPVDDDCRIHVGIDRLQLMIILIIDQLVNTFFRLIVFKKAQFSFLLTKTLSHSAQCPKQTCQLNTMKTLLNLLAQLS